MTPDVSWYPSANIETLKKRAEILKNIRLFFDSRKVIEVETPLLDRFGVSDPYLDSIAVHLDDSLPPQFLQTSPEYAMKRLLAAGMGDCYQICKSFRNDESGRLHHTEFTILEWYRVGFTDQHLIDEIDQLLQQVLGCESADKKTYCALFEQHLQIDPIQVTISELKEISDTNTSLTHILDNKDDYLMWLFSQCIEPELGLNRPCFVTSYPASQASLSRINPNDDNLSCRFELFYKGIELGNGFYELSDATEQLKRFQHNQQVRKHLNKQEMDIDNRLIAALKKGLPDCAGVAIGIDRLMMLVLNKASIQEVMAFYP